MPMTNEAAQALQRLAKTADQLRLGREIQRRQVLEARQAGASWESIARMLRVTKQTAQRVHGTAPAAQVSRPDMLW